MQIVKLDFTIPGEPKAKARPRVGKGFAYTPKETVVFENYVKMCYQCECGTTHLEGQLGMEIDCFLGIPKSVSKKKRKMMIENKLRPVKKPDLDNLAKAIADSLNGIAYKDDSQIVAMGLNKYYSETPRTVVRIKELEQEEE